MNHFINFLRIGTPEYLEEALSDKAAGDQKGPVPIRQPSRAKSCTCYSRKPRTGRRCHSPSG